MIFYRAMKDDNGMPMLGESATTLGIRRNVDIDVDSSGNVNSPAFLPGDKNGLSCSPAIQFLPRFALPIKWGGASRQTHVWGIEEGDLGPSLVVFEDSIPLAAARHVSVGPAFTMTFEEFVALIQATQPYWQEVGPPKGGKP